MLWFISALAAPLIWSVTNIVDKALRIHGVKDDLSISWIGLFTQLPVALLLLFLNSEFDLQKTLPIFEMLIAGAIWGASTLLWYKALSKEETSRVVLIMQLLPIFILILSYLIIDEKLEDKQLISFIFLFAGGFLAAIKKTNLKIKISPAFWLITTACFFWALTDVIFKKYASSFPTFLNAFSWFLLGRCLPSLFVLLSKNLRHRIICATKELNYKLIIGIGTNNLFLIIGSLVFAYALTLGPASLTGVFTGIQPLFVLIFSIVLSRYFKHVESEQLTLKNLAPKGISFILIMTGMIYSIQ